MKLATSIVASILFLAVFAGVAKALSHSEARPFLTEDEIPDEDDVRVTHHAEKKCREIINSLEEGLIRLWASHFTMKDPRIELPTGRHISGLMKIEQYVDHMEDYGISDYTMKLKSRIYATENGCTFEREATWKQDGCEFFQPGMQEIHLRESDTPGMGLELVRWVEHWNVHELSSQYEECLESKSAAERSKKNSIKPREERDVGEIPVSEKDNEDRPSPDQMDNGNWKRYGPGGDAKDDADADIDEAHLESLEEDIEDDDEEPDLHFDL